MNDLLVANVPIVAVVAVVAKDVMLAKNVFLGIDAGLLGATHRY